MDRKNEDKNCLNELKLCEVSKKADAESFSILNWKKVKIKGDENLSFLSSNYQVSKYTSFLSDLNSNYVLMHDEWIWEGIH